jgi:hypothetical protein
MTEKDLKVVIPSRKRTESCRRSFSLVPFADVCVAEEEKGDYAEFGQALSTHPDEVTGVSAVRRWILERYKQRCVVIFDDDVLRVSCLVGRKTRQIKDPAAIHRILFNSATIADAMGAGLFSYAITANVLDFFPYDPFSFLKANGPCPVSSAADPPDPALSHNTDADLTLQALLKTRFVWQDTRFMFEHKIMTNSGGNRQRHQQGKLGARSKYLKRSGAITSGKGFRRRHADGGDNVARRQKLSM